MKWGHQQLELDIPVPGQETFVSDLPACDPCRMYEARMVPARYDAKTLYGPWANLCQRHFDELGIGLGVGRGQRLIKRRAS